jgi:Glucose / Sorbosone dehydrogenase
MKFRTSLLAVFAALALSAAVVDAGSVGAAESKVVFRSLVEAKEVTAVASMPDGTIRFAERGGTVVEVRPDGSKRKVIAMFKVRVDGQRGLVGLDTSPTGVTALSWVRSDGRLAVGTLSTKGKPVEVFVGPATKDRSNGGHLLFEPDGAHVIVGLGDFLQGGQKGKFIRVDLNKKTVEELAVGWNNPFAFDWLDGAKVGGNLLIADNSPREDPELISQLRGPKIGALPTKTAPSALAVVRGGVSPEGIVCGYVSNGLIRYRFDQGKVIALETLADDCTIAVRLLSDRRLVYATESELMISAKPIS